MFIAAAVSGARADVTIAEFPATGQFTFDVQYMTDLDQRRAGLPEDGSKFCVPTSGMNLFAYAANFGFPEVLPGPGLWEGVPGHVSMTAAIGFMGIFMSTGSGTNSAGYIAGMNSWIEESQVPFSFVQIGRVESSWPTVDVGAMLAATGAVVNVWYGRYYWVSGTGGKPRLTDLSSAHAVTLTRAIADNGAYEGPRVIWYRNPTSSDDDLNSNSDFESAVQAGAENIEIEVDIGDDGDYETFVVTSLLNPPPDDDTRYRIITAVSGLYPPGGMSYSHVEVQAQFVRDGLGFSTSAQPRHIQLQPNDAIESLVMHPELHSALAIVSRASGAKQLVQIPAAGLRPITLLELPDTSRQLVVGRGNAVFVITSNEVLRVRAETWSAERVGQTPLPNGIDGLRLEAVAFNYSAGELLLAANGRLFALDAQSLAVRHTRSLGRDRIRGLAVLPGDSRRFIYAAADGSVVEDGYACGTGCSPSRHRIPDVVDPTGLDVDDTGRVYVSERGAGLVELERGEPGKLRRAVRPWFRGADFVGSRFAVRRSHSTFDPALDSRPAH